MNTTPKRKPQPLTKPKTLFEETYLERAEKVLDLADLIIRRKAKGLLTKIRRCDLEAGEKFADLLVEVEMAEGKTPARETRLAPGDRSDRRLEEAVAAAAVAAAKAAKAAKKPVKKTRIVAAA